MGHFSKKDTILLPRKEAACLHDDGLPWCLCLSLWKSLSVCSLLQDRMCLRTVLLFPVTQVSISSLRAGFATQYLVRTSQVISINLGHLSKTLSRVKAISLSRAGSFQNMGILSFRNKLLFPFLSLF